MVQTWLFQVDGQTWVPKMQSPGQNGTLGRCHSNKWGQRISCKQNWKLLMQGLQDLGKVPKIQPSSQIVWDSNWQKLGVGKLFHSNLRGPWLPISKDFRFYRSCMDWDMARGPLGSRWSKWRKLWLTNVVWKRMGQWPFLRACLFKWRGARCKLEICNRC